jgi:hypothetical protein
MPTMAFAEIAARHKRPIDFVWASNCRPFGVLSIALASSWACSGLEDLAFHQQVLIPGDCNSAATEVASFIRLLILTDVQSQYAESQESCPLLKAWRLSFV